MRKLPIGISDFQKLIGQFGKTLNLSMLRYFFERTEESQAHLFHGLAVEQCPEIMA